MVRHRHFRIASSIALAFALVGVTPAWAKPTPFVPAGAIAAARTAPSTPAPATTTARASVCSEVCSAGGYARVTRLVGLRPTSSVSPGVCSEVCSAGGYSTPAQSTPALARLTRGGPGASGSSRPLTPLPSPPHPTAASGGFHWGDAGIGAGAAFAAAALLLGGLALTSARRRTARTSAQPLT